MANGTRKQIQALQLLIEHVNVDRTHGCVLSSMYLIDGGLPCLPDYIDGWSDRHGLSVDSSCIDGQQQCSLERLHPWHLRESEYAVAPI